MHDHHSVSPRHGFAIGYALDDAKGFVTEVSVEPLLLM